MIDNISTLASDKDNGFFGQLKDIGTGLIRSSAELIPVWAAQELKIQQEDQLNRNLFDPEGQPKAIWIPGTKHTYEQPEVVTSTLNTVLFRLGEFPVTSGGLLMLSTSLLVTMILLKKVF